MKKSADKFIPDTIDLRKQLADAVKQLAELHKRVLPQFQNLAVKEDFKGMLELVKSIKPEVTKLTENYITIFCRLEHIAKDKYGIDDIYFELHPENVEENELNMKASMDLRDMLSVDKLGPDGIDFNAIGEKVYANVVNKFKSELADMKDDGTYEDKPTHRF